MKDKKTVTLIVILLVLIGVYVWHSQRIHKREIKPENATKSAPLTPTQLAMRKVMRAIKAYEKEKGEVPHNIEQLKGKYLDEKAYQEAKAKNLQYTYVNADSYRLTVPAAAAPTALAAKKTAGSGKKSTSTQSASTEPTVTSSEAEWKYEPRGRPDPFKPFILASRAVEAEVPEVRRQPKTPLQKMPLSEIQIGLKAIVWGEMGNKALVEDATGKGYVIEPGTYVGQNDGIVKKILQDRIVVEEYKRNPVDGRLVTNVVDLKLKKRGEEEE